MTQNTLKEISTWGLIQACVLIGTVIITFQEVLVSSPNDSWFYRWFDGKVQAMWFILAGVALYKIAEGKDRIFTKKTVLREAAILLGIGLVGSLIWNQELLFSLGFAVLLSLPFLFAPRWTLWPGALLFAVMMPLAAMVFDLDSDWDFMAKRYIHFWDLQAIPFRILINGYYPVLPYFSFVLIGIWLGKKDINKSSFRTGVIALSLVAMFCTFFSHVILGEFAYTLMGSGIQGMELFYLLKVEKMVPMPVFIINTVAWSLFLCMMLITWVDILPKKIKLFLSNMGYNAPWIYVGQILLGLSLIQILDLENRVTLNVSWLVTLSWLSVSVLVMFGVKKALGKRG